MNNDAKDAQSSDVSVVRISRPIRKPTLLILDNNKETHASMSMIFGSEYDILKAESGLEAINIARSRTIYAAIVEVNIPDLSGLETFRRLRKMDPSLEAVAISAVADKFDIKQFQNLGARYFEKPFDLHLLREVVEEVAIRRGKSLKIINESKVIVVGRGRVGKTSLIKRLIHDKFDPYEPETVALDIHSWELDLPGGDWVHIKVWDFGAHDITHSMHQFFLTEQALYVLVLAGREGDPTQEAEYWLQLIGSLAKDSTTIVGLNKIDEHPFEVNRERLIEKHPTIADFVKTDCNTKNGLAALREAVVRQVEQSKIRTISAPLDWFHVKEMLSSMEENFISYDQFRNVCYKMGIEQLSDHDKLASQLNILGTALHYSDNFFLKETQVLKPRWLTEGICLILRSSIVIQRGGILQFSDLKLILNKSYPDNTYFFLTGVLEHFQLCYQLPGSPYSYLIPQLLRHEQPPLKMFLDTEGLEFRYQYTFLPEGLLPRFIVQTSSYINASAVQPWRTGAVLRDDECIAIVRSDPVERRIDIHITGPPIKRRDFLAVIRGKFQEQHIRLPGLNVTERIPLWAEPGVTAGYADMEQRLIDGEEFYRPEGAKRRVNIREVLSMFSPDKSHPKSPVPFIINCEGVANFNMKEETIHGDQITSNIQNSTISHSGIIGKTHGDAVLHLIQSTSDFALRSKIENLSSFVADLVTKATPETAKVIKDEHLSFVSEIVKPNPDKSKITLSSHGLITAAKTMAAIAGPVIKVVEELKKHFGL